MIAAEPTAAIAEPTPIVKAAGPDPFIGGQEARCPLCNGRLLAMQGPAEPQWYCKCPGPVYCIALTFRDGRNLRSAAFGSHEEADRVAKMCKEDAGIASAFVVAIRGGFDAARYAV